MGYVYLLLSISSDNVETHKIGITTRDPSIRVKELQTGNSNEIRCLSKYKTKNYLKIEQSLHRKFSNQKTEAKNEWRTLTDEQVFSFISDCEKEDETINFLLENNSLFY